MTQVPGNFLLTAAFLCLVSNRVGGQYDGYVRSFLRLCNGSESALATGSGGWQENLLGTDSIAGPGKDESLMVGGTWYVWKEEQDNDGLWEVTGAGQNFVAYWTICLVADSPAPLRIRYRHSAGLKAWVWGHPLIDESTGDLLFSSTAPFFRTEALLSRNVSNNSNAPSTSRPFIPARKTGSMPASSFFSFASVFFARDRHPEPRATGPVLPHQRGLWEK